MSSPVNESAKTCSIMFFMLTKRFLLPLVLVAFAVPVFAQMKSGSEMQNYDAVFGLSGASPANRYSVVYLGCDSPGNILFPSEQPEFRFQIKNETNQPLVTDGKADLVPFGTKGIPGDIWLPSVYAAGETKSLPIRVDVPPGGTQQVKVKFDIPEQLGGYAIIFDLGANGRQFGTSLARTFTSKSEKIQYPKMSLDSIVGADALDRMGVQAVRMEWGFEPDNQGSWDRLDQMMKDFEKKNITVLLLFEGGGKQPMGKILRRWLGDDDVMLDNAADAAWMPEQDAEFQATVTKICAKYGWPRGPLTAVSLWNEPWEGISISGWGADMIRFRTLYKAMAEGVEDARKQGADVLVTGCDSSTNSWDKLFPDGKNDYLKWLDACTVHYQGIAAPSTYKLWLNRKGPHGRVQIWDTESWVANTDDRVATIEATDRAAGYDRSMGVYRGNVTTEHDVTLRQADGTDRMNVAYDAWPLAASIGASQHFFGERQFKEFLFPKGLPWIFVFDGLNGNADDGTVVIVGDLGEVLGENAFPFRSVRGLKEVQQKEDIKAKLASLPADAPERAELQKSLEEAEVLSGGLLSMPPSEHFHVYDFYGNPLPLVNGQVQVPLDFRGYYVRSDGSPGSFAKLLDALRSARIEGYEPLNIVAHDALKPFSEGGEFRLTLSNILNRPIQGKLRVEIPGLKIKAPTELSFAPFETKEIALKITGIPYEDNSYSLKLAFDAGADGKAIHDETLHVNQIAKRTITVDGKLGDWKGVLPQSITAKGTGAPTLTEAAWLPFKNFAHDLKAGVATSYMAYDNHYFYFAAKIADDSPDDGTFRFATLDPNQFFYPETSYEIDRDKRLQPQEVSWTPTNPSDALRMSAADPNARDLKLWNSGTVAGLGFVIQSPADKVLQLALYLVGADSGKTVVQITNRQSGKIILRKEIENSPTGAYVVFNIEGQVHITVRGSKNNPVSVGGVFLDKADSDNLPTDVQAQLVGIDSQTRGDWLNKYGKLGQWLAGGAGQFPGDVSIEGGALIEHRWPDGVRRFTYRKDVVLPSGNYPNFDNVQIAFNVLPQADKITIANPPGTMPDFVPGQDTDYEFALNKVAAQFGGGTEIWRLRVPGMPSKNFYPREPISPEDGPVKGGKLVETREGNTRIVEAAIPWSEIPEVKTAADAGKSVKFSFRINDNKGIGMELAEERSVSKLNPHTFHVEWVKHWGNEVEFGFEK